jgi:hypothetical protein
MKRATLVLIAALATLTAAALVPVGSGCGGSSHPATASPRPNATLSTAIPGSVPALAKFARDWTQRAGDATVREAVVVPTTLKGARSIFGPVFSRPTTVNETWVISFTGSFIVGREHDSIRHYVVVELVRSPLRVLAEVGSDQPFDLAPLGRQYRLVVR